MVLRKVPLFFLSADFAAVDAPAAWAEVSPPATLVEPWPTASLTYAPHDFADVRAVGLYFHGARWRYGYTVGLARFFAVGATR